jgi:hypothetical protein
MDSTSSPQVFMVVCNEISDRILFDVQLRYRAADLSGVAPAKSEVLVDGDKFSVIRKRETYENLTALEK